MIENRTDLIEKVYKWLIKDQTTESFMNSDMVETYIQFAEAEINRELKILDLEDTQSYTLSTSNDYVTLPNNYRGVISFEFDSKPYDISFFPSRRSMKDMYGDSVGRPKGYIILGDKIIFNCTPDSEYSMTLDYHSGVSALSDSNDNNILAKFPDLYLYGAIRQAVLNLNDEKRLAQIGPVYANIIERIKEADKDARLPTGSQMRPKRRIS